jgi:hypothetical protein
MSDGQEPTVNIERTVKHKAADSRHGMTLDELDAFVQEAKRQDVPGDTTVRIDSTWRNSIKKIRVEAR